MGRTISNKKFEELVKRQERYSRAKQYAKSKGITCKVKPLTKAEKAQIQDHLRTVITKYHPRS